MSFDDRRLRVFNDVQPSRSIVYFVDTFTKFYIVIDRTRLVSSCRHEERTPRIADETLKVSARGCCASIRLRSEANRLLDVDREEEIQPT